MTHRVLPLIFFLFFFFTYSIQLTTNDSKFDNHSKENQTPSSIHKNLEFFDEQFMVNFLAHFHISKSKLLEAFNDEITYEGLNLESIKSEPGIYLLILGKMYLYNILPKSSLTGHIWGSYKTQSSYLLAYFYFKVAAEKYENAEAYYYLSVLDYYKINPHETFIKNLETEIKEIQKNEGYQKVSQLHYNSLLDYLKNQRFVSVEHNLFMSAMLGHHGAALVLANMFREGIGISKNYRNCTTSLSYYLSVIKQTYVDFYEFRTSYSDSNNFEKQLYAKKKVSFENQQNADIVSSSEFFDSQTIKAVYELAQNYFFGKNGFKKNYVKATDLWGKLATLDHKTSLSMLGMCYFKGQGVPLNRKIARNYFELSQVSPVSEAMLIVMDYFQIQKKGSRNEAINKMKEIYQKRKDQTHSIIKFLFATLVIKGDISDMKANDGILILASAAKEGHLMAKVAMGLLFTDGIEINYDCANAINIFSEDAQYHPFFIDKLHTARNALKSNQPIFALMKYLQLTLIGESNSFINALYILQIEKQSNLNMNQNSWNIKTASQNILYKNLKLFKIVPDIFSFFQNQYNFIGKSNIKFNTLEKLLNGRENLFEQHFQYLKKKIVKISAVTKENSLMSFYQYKMNQKNDISLLNMISNGSPDKLYVLESRYLLGLHHHQLARNAKEQNKDYSKHQYKAFQQYKRATNSLIAGKLLFYLEELKLNPGGIDFEDELFKFGIVDDFLIFTFTLSILIFVLYYKRSKKLDEIHRKELEKSQQGNKENFQEQLHRNNSNQNSKTEGVQFLNQIKNDENQPQITIQKPLQGYRIGGQQETNSLVLEQCEEYRIEESSQNKRDNLTKLQNQQQGQKE